MSESGWQPGDLDFVLLEDEAPADFDCGREEQNDYLRESAIRDQREQLSATYLLHLKGIVVGYITVTMDSLELFRHEKPADVPYRELPALKIAQLGVDRRFAGMGLGSEMIAFAVVLATAHAEGVGCRYVTVDAKPDVVDWYKRRGFKVNQLRHSERKKRARDADYDPTTIPVSMRFDIRDEDLVRAIRAIK